MDWGLKDKVVLVTGSARGIGREMVKIFAEVGARVAINYAHSEKEANELVSELRRADKKAIAVKADVSKSGEVKDMVSQVVKEFGRIDVLVNNASYSASLSWDLPIEKINETDWDNVIAVDVKGTFLCSREVGGIMYKQKSGAIINISSAAAIEGDETCILYSAAKEGIYGFTKSLAKRLAPYVRVNAIAPGSIETDWVEKWKVPAEVIQQIKDMTPLRRFGAPKEIAGVALFLASDLASFITGQVIVADGGILMR